MLAYTSRRHETLTSTLGRYRHGETRCRDRDRGVGLVLQGVPSYWLSLILFYGKISLEVKVPLVRTVCLNSLQRSIPHGHLYARTPAKTDGWMDASPHSRPHVRKPEHTPRARVCTPTLTPLHMNIHTYACTHACTERPYARTDAFLSARPPVCTPSRTPRPARALAGHAQ